LLSTFGVHDRRYVPKLLEYKRLAKADVQHIVEEYKSKEPVSIPLPMNN